MPIALPRTPAWPVHARVLTSPTWNPAAWQERKYWTPEQGGIELLSLERAALPAVSEARLRYVYGQHVRQQGGVTVTTPPDLTGHYVRIQLAQAQERPDADGDWHDVWVGGIEYHSDQGWPGATTPAGVRIFHAVDLWSFVALRWVNTEHNFAAKSKTGSETKFNHARGFPGYNVESAERTIGNLYNVVTTYVPPGAESSQGARYHTWPGGKEAAAWTDEQAVQHQINRNRRGGDPWFEFQDPGSLFTAQGHWPVREGESAFDVVGRICDRRRGRGAVVLEATWTADVATLVLKAYPPFKQDVTWESPDDSGSFLGSDAVTSTISVDLQGDHRCVAGAFTANERQQQSVTYLETVGEHIEIVCTLSYEDQTLQEGWDTAAFQATFISETAPEGRVQAKYDNMYTLHKLKDAWDGAAGDGDGATVVPVYWHCDDAGNLVKASSSDVAPADYQIQRDLPLLVGYDYAASSAARYDALGNVNQPQRRDIGVYLRLDEDEFQAIDTFEDISAMLKLTHEGLYLQDSSDKASGNRLIGDTAESDLASSYTYTDLVFTVSLQLPHRVRMASGDPESSRRKLIQVPGLRLDLVHHLAIWELEEDGAGKRGALGGSASEPGIIRDDRAALAQLHTLAWQWYGSGRVPASWALRCCGLLPSFQAFQGEDEGASAEQQLAAAEAGGADAAEPADIDYPRLGQVVHELKANGQTFTVGTPITRIRYDHQEHRTDWSCDWVELDFA